MQTYPHHDLMQVNFLINLARQAGAIEEPWIQRVLMTLAVTDEPMLVQALMMRLKRLAVIEQICPFPFDTPTEDEFL